MKNAMDDIEERARAVFDESLERIDGATRSRLTQARHAALAELERPRARLASWLPAAALAGAAVLAVVLWLQPGRPGQPSAPVLAGSAVEDLELLTAGDDLDMLEEDVEFYAWAASTVAAGNGIG